MHTTQIVLDDSQYEALRVQAENEQRSIPEVVKEIVDQHLMGNWQSARHRLTAMEGIGRDAGASGRRHDAYLYGMAGAETR